jgi:hypothetical protein
MERATYASDQIQKRWGYPEQDLSDRPPEIGLHLGGESLVFLKARSEEKNKTVMNIIAYPRVLSLLADPPGASEGAVLRRHRQGQMADWSRL